MVPRARFSAVLSAAIVCACSARLVAAVELIHHWKLDEPTGTAVDSVGAANGARSGSFTADAGRVGGGFRTDGSNLGFVNAGNVPVVGGFSLSFWVNPADVAQDWRNMISKHDADGQRAFWVGQHADDGRMRFGMYFNGSTETTLDSAGAVLTSGQWSQVVAMWDESTRVQSLYVNGQLAASATRTGQTFINPRSSNLLFNTNHTSNSTTVGVGSWARFGGATDDVAIWDRPMTPGKARAMTTVQAIPALGAYTAADYQTLFRAYDTAFPQRVGNRRWKHATGLALGEGNAAALDNGFAVQLDAAGAGATSISVVRLTGDPTYNPATGDSIGSGTFPHQLATGDVYVMLWTSDTSGADDRALLRSELDAVSGAAYDLITNPLDPLWQQLSGAQPGFDTLIRFNSAGIVGSFNWDFASHADVVVNQVSVVTTGAVPEPGALTMAAIASIALAARRRGRRS